MKVFITLLTFLIGLSFCNNTKKSIGVSSINKFQAWEFPGERFNRFPIVANRIIKNLLSPNTKLKKIPSQEILYNYLRKVKEAGFNLVTVNLTPSNNSITQQDEYYYNFINALRKINEKYSPITRCLVYDSRIKKLEPKVFLPFILKYYDLEEVYGFTYDEPRKKDFDHAKRWITSIDSLKQLNFLNNKLFYVNLYGIKAEKDYEDYIYFWISDNQPRVLSFDHYPLWDDTLADKFGYAINSDWINDYFLNLEYIRQTSLSNDLPYFNWISIHKHWSDYSKSFYRRASVEDLYFQIFSSLAYGSKGILYYNFWNENPFYINNPWHEEQGILDYDLKETGLYPAVIKINNQLSKLGDTLLQLQSVGVYHKNEKYYNSSLVTNPKKHIELEYLYNPNLEKFEYRYGIKLVDWNDPSNLNEQELKNKFIHNIDNPAALLGLFQGVDSSYYFMLVNKNRRKVEKFTVYIDKSKLKNESAINILELCSNSRVIPSKSNNRMIIISLELSPGYGKLFKIN